MALQHINIRIAGRVHGVYYRVHTRDKALELGVKGFVRNENDGAVYVEAEGEPEKLAQLVAWCKQGPPRAEVRQVDVSPSEVRYFNDFVIER